MTQVTLYETAMAALRAARDTDEVKTIRNQAIMLETYAKQAKDPRGVAYATEIKLRAERALGAMMDASPKAPPGRSGPGADPKATLAAAGINKRLADRARKSAALPEAVFEARVKVASDAAAAASNDALRAYDKAESRSRREEALGRKIMAMPDKRYGVIYMDPPWRYETYSDKGMDRSADNHYPTMSIDELEALELPAARDCVMFMWATSPMLKKALDLMEFYGFRYSAFLGWDKMVGGTGLVVQSFIEPLLIGVRGNAVPPSYMPGKFTSRKGKHSEKPEEIAELIAQQYPTVPKIELFARKTRKGWDVWGNEA